MKCKLLDICVFRKGKVDVSKLTLKTYISTENMLPNKGGVTEASSLPTVQLTQEYKKGDILVSNIRPYFKKIWQAKCDGGCSSDVLVFQGNLNIDGDFLYYILANDDFFAYSMATSKGTKMPRGDKTSIMQYEVPIFDIDTQRKIASVLRSLDEKIELNSTINNNFYAEKNDYPSNRRFTKFFDNPDCRIFIKDINLYKNQVSLTIITLPGKTRNYSIAKKQSLDFEVYFKSCLKPDMLMHTKIKPLSMLTGDTRRKHSGGK